jgi:hypothetical protein
MQLVGSYETLSRLAALIVLYDIGGLVITGGNEVAGRICAVSVVVAGSNMQILVRGCDK